jgi:hypothetical protein
MMIAPILMAFWRWCWRSFRDEMGPIPVAAGVAAILLREWNELATLN